MPLDLHLGAVLQSLAAAGRKPMHKNTVQEGRKAYYALTFGSRTPQQIVPVASVTDTLVGGGVTQLKARVYRPEGTGKFPTVAFFHGGGFVIGDLETHDNMCRELCRGSNAVVVSVEYRLAPEHPFPAAVDDAVAATKWVIAHATELGGTDTVAVAGDSAGGNLAAVVSQLLRSEGIVLAAQFLIYPALDDLSGTYPSTNENAQGYFLEKDTFSWFSAHYIGNHQSGSDPRIAPMQADNLRNLPPALIVTAEFDPLRDHGSTYTEALNNAGSKAELIHGAGMIHGFFDMGRWSPGAQNIINASIRKFGDMLRAE